MNLEGPEPPLDNTRLRACDHCHNRFSINLVACPHCALPSLFPNVSHSQQPLECQALESRFTEALHRAKGQAWESDLADFIAATKNAKAIMCYTVGKLHRAVCSETELFETYYHFEQLRSSASQPSEPDWGRIRPQVDTEILGSHRYVGALHYAALSLTDVGLQGYGDCSIALREPLISHRASCFAGNSGVLWHQRKQWESGKRSDWNNRHKLCVVKHAHHLEQRTNAVSFANVILDSGADKYTDDYIEVHIFGPITRYTIEAVTPSPKCIAEGGALWHDIVTRLNEAGVTVNGCNHLQPKPKRESEPSPKAHSYPDTWPLPRIALVCALDQCVGILSGDLTYATVLRPDKDRQTVPLQLFLRELALIEQFSVKSEEEALAILKMRIQQTDCLTRVLMLFALETSSDTKAKLVEELDTLIKNESNRDYVLDIMLAAPLPAPVVQDTRAEKACEQFANISEVVTCVKESQEKVEMAHRAWNEATTIDGIQSVSRKAMFGALMYVGYFRKVILEAVDAGTVRESVTNLSRNSKMSEIINGWLHLRRRGTRDPVGNSRTMDFTSGEIRSRFYQLSSYCAKIMLVCSCEGWLRRTFLPGMFVTRVNGLARKVRNILVSRHQMKRVLFACSVIAIMLQVLWWIVMADERDSAFVFLLLAWLQAVYLAVSGAYLCYLFGDIINLVKCVRLEWSTQTTPDDVGNSGDDVPVHLQQNTVALLALAVLAAWPHFLWVIYLPRSEAGSSAFTLSPYYGTPVMMLSAICICLMEVILAKRNEA